MAHKITLVLSNIFSFLSGIIVGYMFSIYTTFQYTRLVKRNSKETLDCDTLSAEPEQSEKCFSNVNLSCSKDHIDSLQDELPSCNEDVFYDTIESTTAFFEYNLNNSDNEVTNFFDEVDLMFENNQYDSVHIYNHLKKHFDKYSNNAGFLWRLAKATHFLTKTDFYQKDENKNSRKDLIHEMLDYAKKALALDDKDSNCHKWYAIAIGSIGEFVSVKEKIANGNQFKIHLDIAMSLKDDDPTLYHLAGRFCFELLSLSWLERKVANTFLGTIPKVTHCDALEYFLKAYQLKSDWKENLLYIIQIMITLNDVKKAKIYLEKALSIPTSNSEILVHRKLEEIKRTLG